jgi:hypothetical protein
MRRAWVLLICGFWGCAGTALPPPEIVAVNPLTLRADQFTTWTVTVKAIYPFDVDYGRSPLARVNTTVEIWMGGQSAGSAMADETGAVTVVLIPFLPPGQYPIEARLADGRAAVFPQPFDLQPGLFPTSYVIDPIPDQFQNVPFEITVRAQGPQAQSFEGFVQLTSSREGVEPPRLGPFSNGLATGVVTLSRPGNTVLTVTDAAGQSAQSNDFQVRP